MHSLIRVFEKHVKDFNRRALTEKDLIRICRRHKVKIVKEDSDDMEWPAFFTILDGVPTIFLKASLRGLDRLWALAHEVGHVLLHSPATCFFSLDTVGKAEKEANTFAAYALFPKHAVTQMYLWELYEPSETTMRLFDIRLQLFELHKE